MARPAVLGDRGRSPAGHGLVPARGLSPTGALGAARRAGGSPGRHGTRHSVRLPIARRSPPRPAFPDKGTSPDEAGPAPRTARGRRGHAARRLLHRGRHRPGLAGPGEPVDVAADAFPITGVSDDEHRPVRPQRPRRPRDASGRTPTRSSSARTSPRWRTATSPSTPTPSTRAPTPRPASAARAPRPPRTSVAGNAFYDPGLRPHRLRPGPARGAVRRLRPLPGTRGHGARVRARDAGPVRLRRPAGASRTRPRPTASPAPGPRWVAAGEAEHVVAPRRRSSTTSSAASCCSGTTSAAIRTTPRPTAPTSTGSRRSTRASTAGSAPCRDDFGEDRLFTAAAFDRRRGRTPAGGNAPFDLIVHMDRRRPCRSSGARSSRPPSASDFDAAGDRAASTGPRPTATGLEDRDLGYCAADDDGLPTTRPSWPRPPYEEIGDFAARAPRCRCPTRSPSATRPGLSTDDGAATRSAVCLTGWYDGPVVQRRVRRHRSTPSISPGDIDEAVQFLLDVRRRRTEVFPDVDVVGLRAGRGVPATASWRAATPAT